MRALYSGHVNLAKITFDQYLLFTNQVSRRPDLAQLIHELSLPCLLYNSPLDDVIEVQGKLTRVKGQLSSALKSMGNLTSLSIVLGYPRYGEIFLCKVDSANDLFLGCGFRLKTFRNAGDWNLRAMLPFLREQNQIQDLEIMDEYNSDPAPGIPTADLLPNLSILSISYDTEPAPFLFTVMVLRRLTRLELQMAADSTLGDVESAMQGLTLAPASGTLTHLHFHFDQTAFGFAMGEAEHIEALNSIATALPHLKFLRYSGTIQLNMNVSIQASDP